MGIISDEMTGLPEDFTITLLARLANAKKSTRVLCGSCCQVLQRRAASCGQTCSRVDHHSRLVPANLAFRLGGQVRRVGFDQQSVGRHRHGHLAQGMRVLEGHHAGKTDVHPQLDTSPH